MGRPRGRRSRKANRQPESGLQAGLGKTPPVPAPIPGRVAFGLDRTRIFLIAAVVACATFPYLNTLLNGFVYDDHNQVLKNPYIRSFHYLKQIFTTNVTSFIGEGAINNYYRPMMTLGYLVCHRLFGMRAYGFHLFSLLLHVLVVYLVFVLAERLTANRVVAFAAGAFFALHPIHTESVAWIAAVTDLEVTFFYLLTFALFLAVAKPVEPQTLSNESARLPGGKKAAPVKPQTLNGRCALLMGGAFILTLLSKEQAMTLPALATVYEHFYRDDRSETSTIQKMARYGPLWLVGVAYVLFRIHFLGSLAPREHFPELTTLQIALSAIALIGQYFGKLFWPVRLCAYYVFHANNSLFDPCVLAGLLVILALAALFLVCWRSQDRNMRLASFGVVWYLATLAPVLNAHWVGINVFTERYLYLPSVGAAWLVGLAASKLWRRTEARPAERRALILAGIALAGLFAVRIVMRDRDWNNDVVLFTRTLECSPEADAIRDNLAVAYLNEGAMDKAESVWRGVLARHPDDAPALNDLGLLALHRHQYAEAVEFFHRAINQDPSVMNPHLNLGMTYAEMGLTSQAELQLRAAVTLSPLSIEPHNHLGQLLVEQGRLDEAEEQFRACIRLAPSSEAYDFLGLINIRRRAWGAAEGAFRSALTRDASDSNAHFGLGYIYAATGRSAEALAQYQAGLAKDPTNPQALAALHKLRQTNPDLTR